MKLGIIALFITFNFICYKFYKSKKDINYKKNKNYKNPKIIKKIIVYDIIFILIWLGISFIINKTLINEFYKYTDTGILKYNIQKEINLLPIEDSDYYIRAQKDLDNNYRAMLYRLENGTEVSKGLGTGIKIELIEDENYKCEVQGNLIYDKFLRNFFFQFYSISYKQIIINEKYINYVGGDN